jgi:RNA polymerase sigma-70 factor (ECF subfamily)
MGRVSVPPSEVDGGLVLEALGALSWDHRQVLLECHFAGMSVPAAAAKLDLPPATIKSRVYYALRAFKLALDEHVPLSVEGEPG